MPDEGWFTAYPTAQTRQGIGLGQQIAISARREVVHDHQMNLAVPASEDLGRQFVRPAMAAVAAGDIKTAFDTFMRGVCGDAYPGAGDSARFIMRASLDQYGLPRNSSV